MSVTGPPPRNRRVSVWLNAMPKFQKFASKFEYTEWDQLLQYDKNDLQLLELPPQAAVPLSKIIEALNKAEAEEGQEAPAAAAPAPVAEAAAPVAEAAAVAPVVAAPAVVAKVAAPKAAKKAGSIDRSQTNKIFVEGYGKEQAEPLVLEMDEEGVKTGVFVGNCNGVTVVIKGKIKNITLANCTQCAVVFDNCVTTCEIINCKRTQCQAVEICGAYVIDKCDRTTLYLAEGSMEGEAKIVVYTCQSSSTNVVQSDASGEDQVEHGVPDQILTTFMAAIAPQHEIVLPEPEVPKDQR